MTCFLSPHSDDTILSCNFHIQKEVFKRPYFLCTIFSQSNYTNKSFKIPDKTTSKVTMTRLDEDSRYAEKHMMNFSYFNYDDALLRMGYVCFDPDYTLDQNLVDSIVLNLVEFIQANDIENIVVQQPYGDIQHLDHRITYAAARQLCSILPIALYTVDDFPYSYLRNQKDKISLGKIISEELIDKLIFDFKIYKSQECKYFENQIKLLSQKINYELRYFRK